MKDVSAPPSEYEQDYYRNVLQRGVEAGMLSVVPWCAEHDERMTDTHRDVFTRYFGQDRCRLEEPARHYRIEET